MKHIVKDAMDIIASIAGSEHAPVICGGYARDRALGRKPRDVDIFLPAWTAQLPDVKSLADDLIVRGFTLQKVRDSSIYYHSAYGCAYLKYYDIEINVIPHKGATPYDIVATFDFNICRFWTHAPHSVMSPWEKDGLGCSLNDLDDLKAGNMIVQHLVTPLSTLRRGFRFQDRLGFKFQPSDIRRLVEALYKRKQYGS